MNYPDDLGERINPIRCTADRIVREIMAEDEVKQANGANEQASEESRTAAEETVQAEDAVKETAEESAGDSAEENAGEANEEAAGDTKEEKAELEPLEDIDTEWEAEKLCRWGAARASVLVVAPVLGTMALIANEVYMITRLADLRGVKMSEGTALGLLGSLGATFIGQSVFTLLPIAAIQIPLAVSITENAEAFSNMDCKDEPLGDESKKFDLNALKEKMKNVKGEDLFAGVKTTADKAESTISQKIKDFNDRIVNPLKSKSDRWISAQNWQQLSRGELVILKLSILDFYVDQNEAVAHIKVDGFDIFNNDFASLVVNTVGDKLIVAIIDLVFDKVTIENKDVEVTYENGVIGLDFTKTLQESKIGKTRFLKKSVLDVLHLTNLSVMEEGLKVKASVKL